MSCLNRQAYHQNIDWVHQQTLLGVLVNVVETPGHTHTRTQRGSWISISIRQNIVDDTREKKLHEQSQIEHETEQMCEICC